MNTEFYYMYRDAANYKQGRTTILEGELTFGQLLPFLDDKENFIASQVGLDDLQEEMTNFPHQHDDHVWSEINEHDLTPTEEEPSCHLTAAQLLENFKKAGGKWDIKAVMKRLGLKEGF